MKTPFSRSLLKFAAIGLLLGSTAPAQAAPFFWNVATPGANNWDVNGNWNVAGFPGNADTAIFNATGTSASATAINNIVSANKTVTALFYTNIISGQWHVTQIPAGVTLSVTNLTEGFMTNDTAVTSVAMTDAGTLNVFGTMLIGNSGSNSVATDSILDLSALSNFNYIASSGTMNIGIGNRGAANFNLAAISNFITAGTVNWNQQSSSSSASGTVKLGLGTNIVNTGNLNMAQTRSSSTLSFFGATGGLRLRGVGGTDSDRANMILGNRNVNSTSGTTTGTLLLNGHPVDIKLGTFTVAQANNVAGGAQAAVGNVNFDMGVIDVTTLNMAICATNLNTVTANINVNSNAAAGTIGTLIAGNISLGNLGIQGGVSTGNLNIPGGAVICSGNITKTGGGVANLNITNGTLSAAGTVGTLVAPLSSIVVSNATLQLAASFTATNVVTTNLNALAGANNTINISALPVIPTFPAQMSLIKYTTPSGDLSTFVLGSLPAANPSFQGYISNNVTASSIDLVILTGPAPPPAAKPVVWDGEVSGDWDTTTTNWVNSGVLTNYNNLTLANTGDPVTFNDSLLGTTNVNLTQTLSPVSITVNNSSSNYLFTGIGKLSGATGIAKQGFGSLVIANSGVNDYTGGLNISAGTVQFGNGTTVGNLPTAGTFVDNGSLVINHSDSFTFSPAITGSGSLSQIGSSTLTLSGASSYSGGLTVSKGAVRDNSVSGAGTGVVTVNNGGTFVIGAAITNSMTLSNGILGTTSAGFTMNTNKELIASANSTNIIYCADPQSPVTSFQFLVDGNLRGSGTILVINAPTNNPDGGQGVRFRNTNAVSDFSGTIIYTNNNKGELLTLTTDGGTYSPIGTGKIVLYGGAYDGANATTCPAIGGYSELNLRNNGPGSIIIGNDVAVLGTGAAVINALAGINGITLGNLKIGAGQELIGYKASTTPAVTNTVIFPTVTLNGTATFSPHSASFGATSQFGTFFSLGPITETVGGSGITKGGLGFMTLTGVNNYSGNTTITNGTLFLSGSASIANSPNIILGSGATLDVATLSSTLTLGSSQTLSNFSSTAAISGNADASLGTVSLRYASGTPSFTVLNGALTLASGTTAKVNNTGAALVKGNYRLISAGTAGSVAGTAPSSVTVGGNGTAGAVTPSLQITGNELFLVVPNSAPAVARIVTNSTSTGITWKIAISNLMTAAGWSDVDNDALTLTVVGPTSNLGNSVTKDTSFVYYNAPVTAEDFFTYTISDGTATANGTVYLEAAAAPPSPANATLIVTGGNGVPTITFAGIPGRTNVVQASTNLSDWTAISTNVAGTNGLWQVTDPDATNFVNRFYRSYQPYP